jgi:DNA polymerase III epsilon subunit family exonuclease
MDSMLCNDLSELRDLAHRYLLEADHPVETQQIARRLFGPRRHEMPEAQVVVHSLLNADNRFLRTHCRRWSARRAPHMQRDSKDTHYVVVDLETTGSVIGVDEIMDIGLVRMNGGRIRQPFSTRLRTTRIVPPWVSRLTGINSADLVDAPTLEDMAPEILTLLDDAVFVAHDIRFDMPFLRWELLRRGFGFPCRIGICTLELSRALWPDLASHSLSELATSLSLTHANPHQAGDDALAAAGLLKIALQTARRMGHRSLGDLMSLRAVERSNMQQAAES